MADASDNVPIGTHRALANFATALGRRLPQKIRHARQLSNATVALTKSKRGK